MFAVDLTLLVSNDRFERAFGLLARVRADFQADVELLAFFDAPTVADLAIAILDKFVESPGFESVRRIL